MSYLNFCLTIIFTQQRPIPIRHSEVWSSKNCAEVIITNNIKMPTNSRKFINENLLTILTCIGVVSGAIVGSVLKETSPDGKYPKRTIMYIQFPGELFLRWVDWLNNETKLKLKFWGRLLENFVDYAEMPFSFHLVSFPYLHAQ